MTGGRRLTLAHIQGALRRFGSDEHGATAIEYSLIVALVFLAIVTAVSNVADSTNEMYSELSSAM